MELLASLAGSDARYVPVQGRIRDGRLHVQGAGPKVNRSYGVVVDVTVPARFIGWLASQDAPLPSLAGTGQRYKNMQVREREGIIHLQIGCGPGTGGGLNRDYGVSANIDITDATRPLLEFIRLAVEAAAVAAELTLCEAEDDEEEEEDEDTELVLAD